MIEAPATGAVAPAGGGLVLARRWSLAAAVCLMAAVPALLLLGPAAYRLHLMSLEASMWGLASVALWLSIGAVISAIVVIIVHGMQAPRRGVIIGIAVLTFGGLALGRLGVMPDARADLPPVWDAQTDWSHPIAFSSQTLTERAADGAAPVRDDAVIQQGKWSGKTVADAQLNYYRASKIGDDQQKSQNPAQSPAEARKAAQNAAYYPLKTLTVAQSPAEARKAVEQAVADQGWRRKPDGPGGLIEAANTSRWYGLVSDIAVRISPDEGGARIDVRSTSRTATPDMGANANRVKDVLDALRLSLRPRDDKIPSPLE